MHDALYFPIHRAKRGEITSVGHLRPSTFPLVRPTFEVQKPAGDSDVELDDYLAGVAAELSAAWDHRLPLFADMPVFSPDDRMGDGKHCIEYFFQCLRQQGMRAIPMTGPESIRGPGYAYLEAVAAIAQLDRRGAAVRLPVNQFNDHTRLQAAIDDTLRTLHLGPSAVDLFLDLETIAFLPQQYRSAEGLVSLLLEPLQHVVPIGFRNIVICGSCIPENVDRRYNGRAMRVQRTDLQAWRILVEMFEGIVIKHGDSGVIYALEQDVSGPARPPARVRVSTPNDYVLWRAPRSDYVSLAELVVTSKDFDLTLESWGTTSLLRCARFGAEKGGPTEWVARDTNLSTEVTVDAMKSFLGGAGRLSTLHFVEPESFPWNQMLIDTEPR